MRYETMIETLENQLEDTGGNADTVLAATVQAVSETAWQEADDFRAQLPKKLAKTEPAGPNQQRTLDEFVSRIGELSGTTDMAQAREYAHAGFTVISDAITAGQLRQLMEALPEEYGSLAPEVSGLTGNEETLLAEVRHAANLEDIEQARLLTQAVLAVVAEATSGGQAARLAAILPEDLSDLLNSSEKPQQTNTDRFLDEVTHRSTVTSPETVREHTAAVFKVLRQWAPDEFADTLGHLPQPLTQLSL